MRTAPSISAVLLPLLATPLAGQSVVVPASYANQEGGALGEVASFATAMRQQVLVRGDLLTALRGRQITAVWVRRHHIHGKPIQAETAQLTLSVSDNARSPANPANDFALNPGNQPLTVFDGQLALPASLGMAPPYPWQAPYAVQIPFTNPFTYQGGHLCLEFEGAPQSGQPDPNWWADFAQETIGSTAVVLGTGCGTVAAAFRQTLYARPYNLQPGGELMVGVFGQQNSLGALLFGALQSTTPLDGIGATGCVLHTVPQTMLQFPSARGTPRHWRGSRLRIPPTPQLLSASFFLQGMNVESPQTSNPAGLTTTNGLKMTFGNAMPAASLSVISAENEGTRPTRGEVTVSRGPVLRFDYL